MTGFLVLEMLGSGSGGLERAWSETPPGRRLACELDAQLLTVEHRNVPIEMLWKYEHRVIIVCVTSPNKSVALQPKHIDAAFGGSENQCGVVSARIHSALSRLLTAIDIIVA